MDAGSVAKLVKLHVTSRGLEGARRRASRSRI